MGEKINIDYDLLAFKQKFPKEVFPLIIAFHGTGVEEGSYIYNWRSEAKRNRVMVLTPNRKTAFRKSPNNSQVVFNLIDLVIEDYPVDRNKIFLAGVSSGALVAQQMFVAEPKRWAGAIFLAKPPYEQWAQNVKLEKWPPMLYISGKLDIQSSTEKLRQEVQAVRSYGEQISLLIDHEAGHEHSDRWNPFIFKWLNHPGVSHDYVIGEEADKSTNESRN